MLTIVIMVLFQQQKKVDGLSSHHTNPSGVQLGGEGKLCQLAVAEAAATFKTYNTKQKSTKITTHKSYKPKPQNKENHTSNRISIPPLY